MSEQPQAGQTSERELTAIQCWMQTVITHPDGVVRGIASPEARRQIDIEPGQLGRVIGRSQALTSVERLEIYSNAYYARLLECLREEFPALEHLLGAETFDGFAFGYLQAYPPHSYTLAELGRHFPRYLAETRPADEPGQQTPDGETGCGAGWPDFLIDLATLERTCSEVFSGEGPEGKQVLQPEDLLTIAAEHWPATRLVPAEGLRLLELSYPVHEYATAVRRNEPAAPPPPAPTWLVISRRNYTVRRQAVAQPQYTLLEALIRGRTVGEAIEDLIQTAPQDLDTLAADLQRWFRQAAVAGWFAGVHLRSRHTDSPEPNQNPTDG